MTTGFGEEPTEDEYAWRLDVGGHAERGVSIDDGVSVRQDAGFSIEWTPTEDPEPSPPTDPEPVEPERFEPEPFEPTPNWEQPSSGWGTDIG